MEEEIDIKDSIIKVWKARKVVLFMTLAFMGVGLAVASLVPKKYESYVILMPNSSGKNGSQQVVSSFASMIGIEFMDAKMGDGIPILAYEDILDSTPFRSELMEILSESIPEVVAPISKSTKDSLLSKFSREYSDLDLELSLFFEVDKTKGMFTIHSKSDSPILAFQITQESYKLLEKFIERIISNKIESQLSTLIDNVKNNEERYKSLQERLSDYRDKNRDLSTSSSKLNSRILEDEYELRYSIYSNGLKQLEASKNALSLNRVHFSVIQPSTTPVLKSVIPSELIVLMFTCLGFVLALFYPFARDLFLRLYRLLKANS